MCCADLENKRMRRQFACPTSIFNACVYCLAGGYQGPGRECGLGGLTFPLALCREHPQVMHAPADQLASTQTQTSLHTNRVLFSAGVRQVVILIIIPLFQSLKVTHHSPF